MAYSPRKRLEENVIAAYARVCQIYGIPPNLGRLYALLYLSAAPMSLAELSDAAGLAKSSTSVALRRLERYGFVRRQPRRRKARVGGTGKERERTSCTFCLMFWSD